ncbi:MAG TPA: L-threonylcarbamoyladenylate synthase [Thermoanaerobaculia bacterium]|nr:L-threonylcarbamoyladenylate synthase [Thermoanaerobaculia bacterium]
MPIQWHIDDAPTAVQLAEIAQLLGEGKVLLLPTDTIYGLHALARNDAAVARIAELKGRDETKPFIVLASGIDELPDLGISADPSILNALASIWPAPLTAILPLSRPIAASRGAASIAVRIPALDWLRALVKKTGPLVSTSANRSGEPPVDSPSALARHLHSQLDAVVDGGVRRGEPSAILDLTSAEPRFIREGEKSFTQKVWKTLRKTL